MLKCLFSTSSKAMSFFNVTKAVEASMLRLYPLALADQSWDNVGLLLEPPFARRHSTPTKPKVLLTIDLTTKVAEEALQEKSGVETIVTYRTSVSFVR
jgi:putative NIF3 family GTP cyclohydrolase 1 type 2